MNQDEYEVNWVKVQVSKWAVIKKEIQNFNLDLLISNWKPCMVGGSFKATKYEWWSPPPEGVFKFNVGGVARGKLGPTGIGGARGKMLTLKSDQVQVSLIYVATRLRTEEEETKGEKGEGYSRSSEHM